MAIQILPGQDRASKLGEQVGSGLGQGLQLLMQQKLQTMLKAKEQAKTSKGLESLGIPTQAASQISELPKELQSLVVKNFLAGSEAQGLEQALSSITGEPQAPLGGLEALGASGPQGQEEMVGAQAMVPGGEEEVVAEQLKPMNRFQEILKSPRLKPEHRLRIEQMAQQERFAEKKLTAAERKEKALEQRETDKETLPYYKEVLKATKDSKDNQRRLGRMEELTRKGKLDSPVVSSLLDATSKGIFGFGVNLDSLRSPDSQEFKKLSTEFLKNAKSLFGNRITDNEVRLFMQMVPTLTQSDQGKMRVINNMKAYSDAEILTKNAMDKIIEQNNGRRPRNLETLVEKSVGTELDKLSQEFKKGYNIEAAPVKDKSSFIRRGQKWLGDMPFNL